MSNEVDVVKHQLSYLHRFMGLSDEEAQSLLTIINRPTPRDDLDTRTLRGGKSYDYVPGSKFIQSFNEAFGLLWSFEIRDYIKEDNQIAVQGRWSLTIPGRTITKEHPDGTKETIHIDGFQILKEQYGSAEIKRYASDIFEKDKTGQPKRDANNKPIIKYAKGEMVDLGDDFKGAATDAMKKCGTLMGFFADIYSSSPEGDAAPASSGQLSAFYKRASNLKMDKDAAEAWATEKTGKDFAKLTQPEILGLVATLIDMAKRK